MKVHIEKYNPKWPEQFEQESKKLRLELVSFTPKIEHIGSTSVKSLGAKPIIDILVGLSSFENTIDAVERIKLLGYTYVQEFEQSMPERKFFYKTIGGVKTHHIHMVLFSSPFWKRHLAFRNHLRSNEKDLKDYYELKFKLSNKEWKDSNEYAEAKNSFIRDIENKIQI